jgi:hypothetical protein
MKGAMERIAQIVLVAAATGALCFFTEPLAARALHLKGAQAQLAVTAMRLALAALLALGLALSGSEHRVALLFTVGAAYFAATLLRGVAGFRGRETHGCRTP